MTAFTLVPQPASVTPHALAALISPSARVRADHPDAAPVASFVAEMLGLKVSNTPEAAVQLALEDDPDLGDEGYELVSGSSGVSITANGTAGLFRGVQTMRQLLPASGRLPAEVPGVRIRDVPRFAWRGLMLDVARHFFDVRDVKRVVDLAAFYKLNVLHLHLTDDQGWRLAISSWPDLAAVGGRTAVGGDRGGFYTPADYAEIVDYAARRFITVVPEIDVPGHTNAALVAYPELTCDGQAPPVATGIEVGFSSLCPDKPITQRFIEEVFGELAALTPGPYLHLGGDEAMSTPPDQYGPFVERVQQVIRCAGKRPVGWQEVATAPLVPGAVVQYWNSSAGPEQAVGAVREGARLIMSPADRVYLDMKYDAATGLGLDWAGEVDVPDAYGWDPAAIASGIAEPDVLGVEAALWTETVATVSEIEYMVLPRLPAIAEVGWSQRATRDWAGFRTRLAAHAPRWDAMGAAYHRSPTIPWPH
ncbi:MAG TPA: beta-N-acetylhexosaminidase [Jiangellaceae bacterium]